MRKLIGAAGLAAVVVTGACGGAINKTGASSSKVVSSSDSVTSAPAPAKAATVELVGDGFTQLPADSIGISHLSYGAVFTNTSTDQIAENVSVNLTFTDAAGTVVKSASETIDYILPGDQAAVGDSAETSGATKLEVKALVGRSEKLTQTAGGFSASGVATTANSELGELKTTGTLTSSFAKDLKNIHATAIYYNAAGVITGGTSKFVDFVPAGGKIGLEVTSFNKVPAASTKVFAGLSNLTALSN
jgi:hypothetical protein